MTCSHACMHAWTHEWRDPRWATWKAVIGWRSITLTGQQPIWRACLYRLNNFAQNRIQHFWWALINVWDPLFDWVCCRSIISILTTSRWHPLTTPPIKFCSFKYASLICKILKVWLELLLRYLWSILKKFKINVCIW